MRQLRHQAKHKKDKVGEYYHDEGKEFNRVSLHGLNRLVVA
jgi:hypothetical protein